MIQDGHTDCLVRATLHGQFSQAIAIRKTGQETQTRLGSIRNAPLGELARQCPTLVIEPGQHRLLEDGPRLRRRYLDWTVFHVEPRYQSHWIRYQKALRQRNFLLRHPGRADLSAWDREYANSAESVDAHRRRVFAALQPHIETQLQKLFNEAPGVALSYQRGWPEDRPLIELLAANRPLDQSRGFTQYGPHRAEIRVNRYRQAARHRLSRGQQKLLVAAMVLAQSAHLVSARQMTPILLVDDYGAELGGNSRQSLLDLLLAYQGQVFVTSLDAPGLVVGDDLKMFHVKHGVVSPVL